MPRSARHGRAAARLFPLGEGRLWNRDAIIVADGTLRIVDMKYGTGRRGLRGKTTARCGLYALGALEMFGELYDIDTVAMTIYQPRLSNISTDTITRADLLEWAETVLRPVAELAYKGEGELNAGSWCRFCKLRSTCRKRAEANLALAQHDFKLPPTLSDEEISVILSKLDDIDQLGRGHPGIRAVRGAVRHPL